MQCAKEHQCMAVTVRLHISVRKHISYLYMLTDQHISQRKDSISVKKGQHISQNRTAYQSKEERQHISVKKKGSISVKKRQRISLLGEAAYQSRKGQQSSTQAAHGIFHSAGQ
jgi:hypothetical protein